MPSRSPVVSVNPSWGSRLRLAGLIGLAVAVASPGCRRGTSAEPATDGRHPLTGVVVSIDRARGTLLVDHDEIAGVMPRMTMEFQVAPGDLAIVREGARIRAVTYRMDDAYYLEQVWPEDAAGQRIVNEAARALRRDTTTRGKSAFREVGENLPHFALYDQEGEIVQAARFRGQQIVLNFIFTRCPDPNMCPASTSKMMQLQAMAREARVTNLELVSITLDPEYDTPGVLRDFATSHGIDTSNFTLLTGPEGAIKDLMAQLGVLAFQEGPMIRHTLSTVLIDEDGRIVHRIDGSQWQPSDFASRLWRADPDGLAAEAAARP